MISCTFTHPIDVVKTRLQISGEVGRKTKQYNGMRGVVRSVFSTEGAGAFYKGIGAAWTREAFYSSLRIGLYEPCKGLVGADEPNASGLRKFLAGAMAGAIGSTSGNPFDVLKTRMMAYEGKENRSVLYYARDIAKNQGYKGFYKGLEANIMRASVLNATKMGCYDTCKQFAKRKGVPEGIPL